MPLFYPLGLTSIYEYLELRYGSKAVRLFAVVILVNIIVYRRGGRIEKGLGITFLTVKSEDFIVRFLKDLKVPSVWFHG